MANQPPIRPWLRLASLRPQPSEPNQKGSASLPSSPSLKPLTTSSHDKPSSAIKSPQTVQSPKQGKGIHTKVLDSEDYGMMRAITIAGENKGAYMKIIQSSNKPHKKGNSKDCESEDLISGNANRKDESQNGKTLFSPSMIAYVNSNVQCVNNSLLCHTSCSTNDPGMHLTFSKKGFHLKDHVDG